MEKKINLRTEIPLMVISLIPLFLTLILWNKIPAQVPIHWNISGEIDGYGNKIFVPIFNLGLYVILLTVMFIDPKKENYQRSWKIYNKIRLFLSIFFVAISAVIIMVALGFPISMDRFLLIALPLLFALLGNFMLNIKPNWFMGVRTPWTLSSETVWRKTHRLTGVLWFWAGLACFVSAFFTPAQTGLYIFLATVIIISVIPITYSYILFRNEKTASPK